MIDKALGWLVNKIFDLFAPKIEALITKSLDETADKLVGELESAIESVPEKVLEGLRRIPILGALV